MIFLIGFENEKTFAHIVANLGDLPAVTVLDLDAISHADTLRHRLTPEGLSGAWDDLGFSISAGDIVFHRAYFRDMGDARRSAYLARFLDALSGVLIYPDIVAANPFYGGSQNMFKPAHLASLASLGFTVPETVAGSTDSVSRLVAPDGSWISKGCSARRTEVTTLDKSDYASLERLKYAPVQFQKKAPGRDVRVHFFGRSYRAVEIDTNADDYRYASRNGFAVGYRLIELPLPIVVRCREYMRQEGMLFAGFDFRKEGDEWVVLECNPMPGYDFYDRQVEGEISRMIRHELERMSSASDDGSVLLGDVSAESFIGRKRRPETDYS